MRFKLLGRSGLRVSELCLGTMTFGEEWGWGSAKDESRRVFDAYGEAGGNFLDTADLYTNGTSEKMVGEFVRDTGRERWIVATKYTFSSRRGDANASGNHRKHLTDALNASLKRLGTDYIDLYWVHAWDQMTPVEETMRALDDAVRAGKVLYIGVSNWPAWLVARGDTMAELRGWTRIVSMQIEYHLIERTPERELLPLAEAMGMTIAAWSPLASGILTGKYSRDAEGKKPKRLDKADFVQVTDRGLRIADEVMKVGREINRSAAEVALAWLTAKRNVIPILGARKLAQFRDNLGCLEVKLSPEQMKRLDEVSAIEVGYPTSFLTRPGLRDFLHGGTFEQVDK